MPAIITDPEHHVIEPLQREPPIQQALTVFPPNEPPFMAVAQFDPQCTPASWHWPEYVPAKGELKF